MQYHFRTVGDAMYAPYARSSFASVCSTRFDLDVTFFALSFGTVWPQFVHWTTPEDPFPPLVRPRLARFNGILLCQIPYLYLWVFGKWGVSYRHNPMNQIVEGSIAVRIYL